MDEVQVTGPMAPRKRETWIDAEKGIGIILVMFVHVHCIAAYVHILEYFTSCMLALFFVLAGYTYKRKGTFREFLVSKAQRLLIPYVLYNAIFLALYGIYALFNPLPVKFWFGAVIGVLNGRMSLIINNAPMWFLPAIFFGYLFFRLLEVSSVKTKCLLIPLYFLLPALSPYCSQILTHIAQSFHVGNEIIAKVHLSIPFSLDIATFSALLMYVGFVAKRVNISLSQVCTVGVFLVALGVYIVLVKFNGVVSLSVSRYGNYGSLSPFICLIVGALGTYLYAKLCIWTECVWVTKALSYLGRISMTLMCTHRLVFTWVFSLMDRSLVGVPPWVVGPALVLLSTAFATLWLAVCRRLATKMEWFRYL